MGDAKFVGVDGCPAGWFSVALGEGDDHGYEVAVFSTFHEIVQHYNSAAIILVDIPIGLRESGPEERQCDVEARIMLRHPRRSSVFRAPTRKAAHQPDRRQASVVEHSLTGKKIGAHSWGIIPKIAEVDSFFHLHQPADFPLVREIHPEVLFCSLNQECPMEYSKKKMEGRCERIHVLSQYESRTRAIYASALDTFLRKAVARDDILDALAAAVTARLGYPDRLATLPDDPPTDARGLPMEMVFYNPRHA